MPKCMICGVTFKLLNSHITRTHKIATSEYRDMFGEDTPFTEESVRQKQRENGYSPFSVKGVSKKFGVQEDEAKERVKDFTANIFGPETCVWSEEFWLKRGFSEEAAKKEVFNRQSRGLDRYIRVYGEDEGNKKYLENCKRQSETSSKEYFLQKGMTEEEIREMRDNFSIPTLMKKYSISLEEAESMRRSRLVHYSQARTPQFWIKKGYSEEDAIEAVQQMQQRGKDWWERKYPDDWEERYAEYLHKTTVKFCTPSKEQLVFFQPLLEYCENEDIHYELEYKIKNMDKIYYIDLVIPSYNLAFEYDGEAFHPDPQCVDESWTSARSGRSYAECLENDNIKSIAIKESGLHLIRIHAKRKYTFDLVELLKGHINGNC